MYIPRFFQIILCQVVLFQQIENMLLTKNDFLNILLIEYSRNLYKPENILPDFTSIILNEQLVQALNSQQQLKDVQSLYNEAINKMYDQIALPDLIEQFWKIYKQYDVQSFITMTRAQLALYWRYRLDGIQDPNYVLLAAHCFYKIKNDVFFSRLDQTTQHLVNTTVQSLPSSLQYLFGKQEFCLCNDHYLEIIYQTTNHKINGETSQVLSSSSNKVNTEYMGLIQPIFEETKEDYLSDLNLALVSKHLRGYFHRLSKYENKIGANDTKRRLKNFLWSVELVDDNQLVFRQEDFLMCRQGSSVYGLKNKTIYDKECQWSAGECNKGV